MVDILNSTINKGTRVTTNKIKSTSVSLSLKILSPAIVIFGAYFIIRVLQIQPITEAGLGDFITSVFFLAGASAAYFVYILKSLGKVPASTPGPFWWLTAGYFLMFLAFDEIFAIHEWISLWLAIRDIWLFLLYASILVWLIYTIRQKLSRFSLAMVAAFVVFAGISVVSDALMGEGMISIFGRAVDFEQIAESLAAFALATAFISLGIRELSFFADDSSTGTRPQGIESTDVQPQQTIRS